MTGRLTLWGASEHLNTNYGRTTVPPSSYYLALIRAVAPTPYLSGSELDEPVGGGYERMEIPNDSDHWGQAGQLQVTANLLDITFLQATDDWGQINYWALCDAIDAGNNYYVGDMQTGLIVASGDVAVVGAGNISIALGPFFTEGE
jgi:hypothetical protein